MSQFAIRAGSQHFVGPASFGLFGVGADGEVRWADVGVGLPGRRSQYHLALGESAEVDGVGRLTLVEVHLGEDARQRAALFDLAPV